MWLEQVLMQTLIVVIIIIIFIQGIYNYLTKTNYISRVYSVEAVLYLQFVLHVM